MRFRWAIRALLACGQGIALAQSAATTGALVGAITDPDSGAVKDAVIQARNSSTGAVVRVNASLQGEYALDLPPGTYDLAVPMPCCQWGSFAQANVTVRAGESRA